MFRAVWWFLIVVNVSANRLHFENFLDILDEEFGVLNSVAAEMGWQIATKPTKNIENNINSLNELRAEWKMANCERLRTLWPKKFKTSRAIQLLCHGAMYSPSEARNVSNVLSELREIYQKTIICVENICGHIEPDLAHLMEKSNDADLLFKVWYSWHKAVGPPSKDLYAKLVEIMNKAARRNGYSDVGEAWRDELGINNLEDTMERIFNQILPLYKALHAVVRFRLGEFYGSHQVPAEGLLPAHLLGNMWGQSWTKLFDIVYKNKTNFNITKNLIDKNFTVDGLVHAVDDFYTSIGFPPLTEQFWMNSKWENKEGVCHGTSVNMFQEDDFRILFCASVTEEDFHVLFHEVGHVQYFMAYQQQMNLFKDGANSAMHEAIGEAVAMAGFSPKHLQRLGVLQEDSDTDLQHLLRFGLKLLPQIPFSLVIDKWRWAVFRGDVKFDEYNDSWWTFRNKYQGVASPVSRSGEDFDAASKFHVSDNVPYARYFIASILQVQIFDSMCNASFPGKRFLLHECDIYGRKNATVALREMMMKGSTIDFEAALKMLSSGTLSVEPLLRFFAPLKKWLETEIEANGIPVGWGQD